MKQRKMFKVNFKFVWTACIMLMSLAMTAQEICDNGIDDDGDTMIDLNDDECSCDNIQPLTSIMGNPCRTLNLTFDIPGATTYQWYKDGIAITGYNLNTIAVTRFNPTGEGTYKVIATTPNGTVSSDPYLVERDEYETDLGEIYLCEGDTLHLNGFAFFKQGKQKFTTKTIEFNCDSTVYFEIFIDDPSSEILNETICTGGTYVNGNIMASQPGRYLDTLRTATECDSLIRTVNLTLEDLDPIALDAEICSGDTYIFHDISETTAGEYSTTVMSGNGCDTTFIVNLTVVQPATEQRDEIICQGGLFEFNDISESDAGMYSTILKSATDCDSVELTINLIVAPPDEFTYQETICQGKTFTFRDIEETEAGTYQTVSSSGPCDSLIIIELTVTDPEEMKVVEVICQGASFDWRGKTYDRAGTFTDLESMPDECDVLHILELSIADPSVVVEDHVICEGEFVEKGDLKTDVAGTYDVVISGSGGCDEFYQINVFVNETTYGNEESVLCNGDTYTLYDLVASAPGSYEATTLNSVGCDSIINVELLANNLDPTIIDDAICPGDSIEFHGQMYSEEGSYPVTLTNQYNCDSIVMLQLAINATIEESRDYEFCRGDTLKYGDVVAFETGSYVAEIITGSGCDSMITLNLAVLDETYADIEREICYGENFVLNDIDATEEGSYMTVMQNQAGCDSIVTVQLLVHFDEPNAFTEEICEGDVYDNGSISATLAGRYEDVLTSSTGCDSTIVIDLQVNPLNQGAYEFEICPGDAISFYGEEITEPGSYTKRFSNENSCDSVVTYTVAYDATLGDVEVEPEFLINRGSTVDLEPIYVDDSFVSVKWLDADREIMSIEETLSNYKPDEDTHVFFVATNANGCEIEKRVRINVELVVNIFVPNVITPDSDTYDSFFNIRANESVVALSEVQIYDRWGELMHTSSHQGSLETYFGWDGVYKNKKVLPGVYTYAAVFEIIDGTYVKKAGDLTVIR